MIEKSKYDILLEEIKFLRNQLNYKPKEKEIDSEEDNKSFDWADVKKPEPKYELDENENMSITDICNKVDNAPVIIKEADISEEELELMFSMFI